MYAREIKDPGRRFEICSAKGLHEVAIEVPSRRFLSTFLFAQRKPIPNEPFGFSGFS